MLSTRETNGKTATSRDREIPNHNDLVDYNYAVAGHAGTMCDADGELFIKPCTQSEVDFYESAHTLHPEFAEIMPLYIGTLSLNETSDETSIHEQIPDLVEQADIPSPIRREIQSHLHLEERQAILEAHAGKDDSSAEVKWVPNKTRKIATDKAVVLENASFGYKKPNIMDAKLGERLWADDAPPEKKKRFAKIAAETTHKNFGFRVAGMRVYQGSTEKSELDKEGYRIYDKDWGRFTVNDDNLIGSFKKFIFNEAAGIDKHLGKVIAGAFATDLRRVVEVLESVESCMYSASVLLVFEGDGDALRAAIQEAKAGVSAGIGMDDEELRKASMPVDMDELEDDSEDESSFPRIYSVKLIDFAHAAWTPGRGPDENVLKGVRSLVDIFDKMSQ
ncbi:Uu.00g022130.m01.CDS01 [Anthostomella pinea]|uniref:Kinase n=1 Tax=Anthostomella pinea TaxID=933095 RepID=A0AAI8VZS0_9PEZI|nr:Uu.00g022130.m01.CDS01 [Anthostomella pinea]